MPNDEARMTNSSIQVRSPRLLQLADVFDRHRNVRKPLQNHVRHATRHWLDSLHHRTTVHSSVRHDEPIHANCRTWILVRVLGVADRATQDLLEQAGATMRLKP